MSNAFTRSTLWGDLFSDPDCAALLGADAFLQKMIRFEEAWTKGQRDNGLITEEIAEKGLTAIAQFSPDLDDLNAGTRRDGLPVPALVKQLRAIAPPGAIHHGATSQDVIDTAMILTLVEIFDLLEARLTRVLSRLKELSREHGARALMGRTRMQAALPITVADRIEKWRAPLLRHQSSLTTLRGALAQAQIGGPVGLREDAMLAAHVADHLGLKLGPVWHSDRAIMVDIGHWFVLVTGALGKIGQDIALMAQQGVEEITFSGGGGSSAMPHKQNPILAETLVTLSRFVAGQQGVLAQALVHEQERSGSAWALEWMTLPSMLETTGAALRHTETLLDQTVLIGT